MAEVISIAPQGLTDQVAARLRTMLIEGRVAPGAKLNERVLAEQLRVSRTPLREAIKLLAVEGLVDLLPNRGAVAVKLTEADIVHSFEVLAGLEALSGRFAAQRIDEHELAELRALHYEMLAAYARRDLSNYYRLNALIHAGINAAARQHRHFLFARDLQRDGDVFGIRRHENARRHDLVDRRVGGVAAARGGVEHHLAAGFLAQARFEGHVSAAFTP
jgi:DNA-binding GntR family transcriptional regulator